MRHSRSGLTWYDSGEAATGSQRQEAFPQVWDRHPDALLRLMLYSRCEGVHMFAARALRDNDAYCAALPLDTLRDLLRGAWLSSARFAFDVARARFEPDLPDALQYALERIGRDPGCCADATDLIVALLCAPLEAARR